MGHGWFTAKAIRLHVSLVVVFPGCLALGWWQLNRALGGNTLSWVYTFEWPFFAGYAVYMWRRLLKEVLAEQAVASGEESPTPGMETGIGRGIGTGIETGPNGAPGVLYHDESRDPPSVSGVDPADGEDEELAAYNRYLAELNAAGDTKHW